MPQDSTLKLTLATALMVFLAGLVVLTFAGLLPAQGLFHADADLDTSTIDDLRVDHHITLTVHGTIAGDDVEQGA